MDNETAMKLIEDLSQCLDEFKEKVLSYVKEDLKNTEIPSHETYYVLNLSVTQRDSIRGAPNKSDTSWEAVTMCSLSKEGRVSLL